jgi:hypothetical protein
VTGTSIIGRAAEAIDKLIERAGPTREGGPLFRRLPLSKLDPEFEVGSQLPAELSTELAKTENQDLRNVSFAVVDLKDFNHPRYAGHMDTVERAAASMGKIAVLYAAFQLRADLESIIERSLILSASDISKGLRDRLTEPARDAEVKRIVQPGPPPKLERIYSFGDGGRGWKVEFLDQPEDRQGTALRDVHRISEPGDDQPGDLPAARQVMKQISFLGRLRLALHWSDDVAAATCIRDLGFRYINALMHQAGLRDDTNGGLWIGVDYDFGSFDLSPVGGFKQAATARAAATLMTLIARNRLIDFNTSEEMLALLEKDGPLGVGERSPFRTGLRKAGRWTTDDRLHSKLGFLRPDRNWDCALIERKVNDGHSIRYVAVGLDMPEATFDKLAVAADNAVLRLNGVSSP